MMLQTRPAFSFQNIWCSIPSRRLGIANGALFSRLLLLLLESRGPEAGHSRYLSRHLPKIEQKKSYFLIN